MKPFDQRQYWRERLSSRVDMSTVGHKSLGEHYNRFLYARRFEVLQRALSLHGIDPRVSSVLDIGCGSGIYTAFWKERGAGDYTGVDLSQRGIDALTDQYPQYRFVCGDVTEPEFTMGRSFDIVTLFDVLYHITDNARATQALMNIAAMLKPHGKLLAFDQLTTVDDYQLRPHVKFRSLNQFMGMLNESRLKIVSRYALFHFLSPSIRGRSAVDLPVCSGYAAVGMAMRSIPCFGSLVGRTVLTLDRLLLDRLKTRPQNGELFIIAREQCERQPIRFGLSLV